MGGEYSRELSTEVFQGACRLNQLGLKQGGSSGYALRWVYSTRWHGAKVYAFVMILCYSRISRLNSPAPGR